MSYICSGGILAVRSRNCFCSCSASAVFPVLAKATPRSECPTAFVVTNAGFGAGNFKRSFQRSKANRTTIGVGRKPSSIGSFHAGRNIRNQFVRRVLRFGKITVHAGSERKEVKVVAVIHHSVNALLLRFAEEFLVGDNGRFVALCRCEVVSDTGVNVRRHMPEVSFGRS